MDQHIHFMQQALALAKKARFHAPPNPWVGCLLVNQGQIVGQGYTQPPGHLHAEACALQQAKDRAKGATLYVTLEPCMHIGRTPPCTQALIQAGIQEVYVGIQDPDFRVRGKGIAQLRQAGIKVFEGVYAQEIQKDLLPYLHQRHTGYPYTVLKAAISLDGRMAAADQSSQWLTNREAREDAHLQRAASQAILIGSGTALKDQPLLTVRHPQCKVFQQPLRVILDGRGRVPAEGPLFDLTLAPTLIITTVQAKKERVQEWEAAGVEIVFLPTTPTGLDLQEVWRLLGQRSILQLLVEGGSTVHSHLLETSLFHHLLIYLGPLLLGHSALPLYQKKIETLQQARRLQLQEVQRLGECLRLDYHPSSDN